MSIRRILGALLLVYGSILVVWIGYNFIEMTERFAGRSGGAGVMAFASLFIGWRWVLGRRAFDGTDGKPRELPSEVAPEITAAYPKARCACGWGRFLKLRTGGLWCDLCKVWVVAPPPSGVSKAEPGDEPDRC